MITEPAVIAWLHAQAAAMQERYPGVRATSCGVTVTTEGVTTWVLHADEKCVTEWGDIGAAFVSLDRKFEALTPELRARQLRERANAMLADAERISPVVVPFTMEAMQAR